MAENLSKKREKMMKRWFKSLSEKGLKKVVKKAINEWNSIRKTGEKVG